MTRAAAPSATAWQPVSDCRGRAIPFARVGASGATLDQGRTHRPCHQRAIHSGPDRSPADNHGQRRSSPDLRDFTPPQVTIPPPDLALGARGRLVEACIGLAVPGRPIGPWSRRTGAPEASATGRDRTPMLKRLLTGRVATRRDERIQDGTARRHLSSLKG
jgi:hypothetical protein